MFAKKAYERDKHLLWVITHKSICGRNSEQSSDSEKEIFFPLIHKPRSFFLIWKLAIQYFILFHIGLLKGISENQYVTTHASTLRKHRSTFKSGLHRWLTVKNLPAMQGTQVQFLGWEDPLEKEMAIHFSILAWEIPWIEQPVGYSPCGNKSAGHGLTNNKQNFQIRLFG